MVNMKRVGNYISRKNATNLNTFVPDYTIARVLPAYNTRCMALYYVSGMYIHSRSSGR